MTTDFIKRCFILTPQGRAFLDQTTRRKIPCRPADDRYNNPPWLPDEVPATERRWRVKVYAMENDPEALLARVVKDFPGAKPRTN